MALHLVTGYAGKKHITSMNDGAFNAGIIGAGQYVLESGNRFAATVISNNEIKILDGDGIMQGRHFTLDADTSESVTIANGITGLNRKDLIVARYTKSGTTGVEEVTFAVIQGTSTSGTASDPEYTTGDILSGGATLHEMPLYRVPISGLNVGTLECLFETVDSMASLSEKTNTLNENLTASDNTQFRFATDGEGNYGYLGADDSFIPFKSGTSGYKLVATWHGSGIGKPAWAPLVYFDPNYAKIAVHPNTDDRINVLKAGTYIYGFNGMYTSIKMRKNGVNLGTTASNCYGTITCAIGDMIEFINGNDDYSYANMYGTAFLAYLEE